MDIPGTTRQYPLTDLREFTEYSFHVSAFNNNGEGGSSEEITVRTYSDIPADPPQNVTLEPASSSSVIGESRGDFFARILDNLLTCFICSSSLGATAQGVSERRPHWVQTQVEEIWQRNLWT